MASILGSAGLLNILILAIEEGGWNAIVASNRKPFAFKVFKDDEKGFPLHVFIWNCTHGGGRKRADDEYRIQVTGQVPTIVNREPTLLLGWHEEYGVFVGWDIKRHSGQNSKSPSAQVKEEALRRARDHAFAIHERQNSEIVVAFRPEFLVEYALNYAVLHEHASAADFQLLNELDKLPEETIGSIQNAERRKVVRTIETKYRAYDFRKRILAAYRDQCAMCGIQLSLIDAAHIIPVAHEDSTDETSNGVALCKLHHAAYDNNLVSFDERYRVEVSEDKMRRLSDWGLSQGGEKFIKGLREEILLPENEVDYPDPEHIVRAREVRGWGG